MLAHASDNLLSSLPIFMTCDGNVIQLDFTSAQYGNRPASDVSDMAVDELSC
jgi:hypothetical protein